MIELNILNWHNDLSNNLKKNIKKAFNLILKNEGLNINAEVSLEFVSDNKIRELNQNYRNIDKTTDVLSFPIFSDKNEILCIKTKNPLELGDIIINLNQASKQAKLYGNSLDYEVLYLAIHSFLHLLGYDHIKVEDKKIMRNIEKKIIQDGKFYETR